MVFEKATGDVAAHFEVDPAKSSDSDEEITWTEEEEKRIRNKIDWKIVPTVTFLYLLCFLDRANIGNARIQGMAKDLNLVGYRFNIAVSIFYIIYLMVEIPSNVILKKVGPKYYIPLLVAGFGLVSVCTAFVKTFAELCVARAFLGIFEGGTMPGIAFFLSCFYKRHELYFRVGIYVSAASMAGAFGGLLATGLSRIPRWGTDGSPIHTWRNIFFFEGVITIIAGLAAPLLLPQSPETCMFLTERERYIARQRLILEHKTDPMQNVKMRHVKRAVFNVNNIVAAGGFFCINVTVQGISVFMPTVLKDLGWTATKAQLYSVPPYVCACFVAIGVALVSDKTKMRGIYLGSFTILGITGFSLMRWNKDDNVRYAAVYLLVIGAFPGGPGFLSWALNSKA
jgi:sugar phosphate permease